MKKLIVANWKMNPSTVDEAEDILSDIKNFAKKLKNLEIVICPPFVYIDRLSKFKIQNSKFKLGGQDVFWEKHGSYTGEVSVSMLKNVGAKYVIVGHSERRKHLKETDEMVNKKIKIALKNNLKVIFCVGESERDESGDYLKFIKKEIIEGLDKISRKDLKNLLIVYEPVWAISTSSRSLADTPEDLFQMTIYIKRVIFSKFGRKIAEQIPILYGGSVDASSIGAFLAEGNVRGVLVGRASWKAKTFTELLKSIC